MALFVPQPDEEYEVIAINDPAFEHAQSGFCYDMPCPCHEDKDNIHNLGQAVTDGLASTADADRIYRGRTV